MELVTKFLRRTIHGVPVNNIIKDISSQDRRFLECGFWVNKKYYHCVSKLFVLPGTKTEKFSNKKCFNVIKKFGIRNTDNNNEWPSCATCFKQCADMYMRGEINIV